MDFLLLKQIARYGIVGVFNNLLGYAIYLAVTWWWLEPKLAVTLLYPVAVITAYFGHSRYSFASKVGERDTLTILRYVLAHLIGYGVNVLMLFILSDSLKLPHQLVQAAAIFVVAGVLFLLMKYFVFTHAGRGR